MRITKFLATGLVAVMMVATATGCGRNTADGTGSNKKETVTTPTSAETHADVNNLNSLVSSNATSMQWKWYEGTAEKLANYKFTDYKTLKYADEYMKDRVVFTAAAEQLKEDLSDYEQYYQVAKIAAISTVKNAFTSNGVDYKNVFTTSKYNDGNAGIKSVCEVYPIDFSTEKNRLIYFAGVELTDGTVSEMIGSVQFVDLYVPKFVQGDKGKVQDGTEEEPTGGKIMSAEYVFTTDNDLVTMKFTMSSYNKDADNNKDVVNFDGDLIAR